MESTAILSGKGGVGKTFVAANLGPLLQEQGKKTLLVDADVTGANLIQHFGLSAPVTLNDVLAGHALITQAYYKSQGIGIVPSSFMDFSGNPDRLKDMLFSFDGKKDHVIVDGPSGAGEQAEQVLQAVDSVIIVSEPLPQSLTNAYGIVQLCKQYKRPIKGVIANNVHRKRYEVSDEHVADFLESPLLGSLPDAHMIRRSMSVPQPFIQQYPRHTVSRQLRQIAGQLTGQQTSSKLGVWERCKEIFS